MAVQLGCRWRRSSSQSSIRTDAAAWTSASTSRCTNSSSTCARCDRELIELYWIESLRMSLVWFSFHFLLAHLANSQAFTTADSDRSGRIESQEIHVALQQSSFAYVSKSTIDELMKTFDKQKRVWMELKSNMIACLVAFLLCVGLFSPVGSWLGWVLADDRTLSPLQICFWMEWQREAGTGALMTDLNWDCSLVRSSSISMSSLKSLHTYSMALRDCTLSRTRWTSSTNIRIPFLYLSLWFIDAIDK